jgi:hypothetical protein
LRPTSAVARYNPIGTGMKRTTKTVEVDLVFQGTGRVEKRGDHVYGGIVEPNLSNVGFTVHRQEVDDSGILNPVDGEDTVVGSLQVNVYGTSAGYRELGRYFLALAELDTSADEDFHVHLDDLRSRDGRTHLHAILRKHDP